MNLSFITNYAVEAAISAGLISILYGLYLSLVILRKPMGDSKMNAIADAISLGANAFMRIQYMVISAIGIVIFAILFLVFNFQTALGFAIGAFFSALAGVVGMSIAVRSNIRCAEAAKSGLSPAFSLAFKGGAVTGFLVAGLALASVAGFYYFLKTQDSTPSLFPLIALGFGGSLISVFARLGGGIYTKSADVGTDMVGKIEKGIPE